MEARTAWLVQWPDNWLETGVPFLTEARIFTKTSIPPVRPIQFPVQQALRAHSPKVKRPRHIDGHSSLSNTKINNGWNSMSVLSVACVACIGTN